MRSFVRFLLIALVFLSVHSVLNAQVPGGGGPPGGGDPTCWPPPCIPIDGGISILVMAGLAIGAKKMYDLKR